MASFSTLILILLFAWFPICLAQHTAWIGCYSVPAQPINGVSISSSNTWTPQGCTNECRGLPQYGFAPVTYAFFSPVQEIGDPITTHCLCTNSPPENSGYNGPSDPQDCQNDNDYSASLVDTTVQFQGCWASYDPSVVIYDQLVNTYSQCIEGCSSSRWIAVDHWTTDTQIRCLCSPFNFHGNEDAVPCDDTSNKYMFYTNDVSVQPSARAEKRRQE
ncbi:hypothetical protein I204_06782 [Kwoniella mangroviensis CBS 8886]|nr:hypothetical protein I204_06782 [Kwoniella mangroviensis CBS 8886]